MRRPLAPKVIMAAVALAAGALLQAGFAAAEPCEGRSDVLGVSRVLEIDATGGPRYGLQQYKDHDVLADHEVVLTFDDGPLRRHTMKILDALDAECTKATFFTVGKMALADPSTLREMARRGHTIATHTWSHKRLFKIGDANAQNEIELGISAVSLALGEPTAPFFRFPYLGDTRALRSHLEERSVSAFSIDVDSRDFMTSHGAVVIKKVMSQLAVKKKGVILFHDIQPSTSSAITKLLADLRANGFKVVHVVPKGPVATLPEFDALAAKEARRRNLVLSANPLSDRAVVWPIAGGEAGGEQLPWQNPAAESAASGSTEASIRPRSPKRPDLKPSIDDDTSWATSPLTLP